MIPQNCTSSDINTIIFIHRGLTEEVTQEIEKNMPKLQYHSEDLARLLSIGRITDMFVVVEDGKQILRIECTANPGNEYKTVTTKGAKKTSKPVSHKGSSESRESRPNNPEGLGQKVMSGVTTFMTKKTKPPWME